MQEFFDNKISDSDNKEDWQILLANSEINKFDLFVEKADDWFTWVN